MIETTPIVLMTFYYETTMDLAKFEAAKKLAAQLQAQNSPPVADSARVSATFRRKIQSCVTLQVGRDGQATIQFTVEPDGSVKQKPKIIQGDDPANGAYAKAIARGILKCQPYADVGLRGTFQLKFRSTHE